MNEIINQILENGFRIENTCDFETMQDSYESIMDLIDSAEEKGIYTKVQSNKADEMGGYSYICQIGWLHFVIVRNTFGIGFLFLESESIQSEANFQWICWEIQREFGFNTGSYFNKCIFDYENDSSTENKPMSNYLNYVFQRIRNTVSNMTKAEYLEFCKIIISEELNAEISNDYDAFFNIGWNDISPVSMIEYIELYMVFRYHIKQIEGI